MLEAWVAAGLDPAQFWGVTPAEFQACLKGAEERVWRDLRRAQGIAWSQAMVLIKGWHMPKARQDFAKAFPDPKKQSHRARQSDGDMLNALRLWIATTPN